MDHRAASEQSGGDDPLAGSELGQFGPPSERTDTVALARGAPEESRTITFDSSSLTIMIRIDVNSDGTVRVDGWLAPPQCREIEMTTTAGPLSVISDEQGRFAFDHVPRGTSQLTIRPAAPSPGGAQRCVVTPALVL